MRTLLTALVTAAFLAALALATGCEDSPVTVGTDFKMTLTANPSGVVVDPSDPNNRKPSTITATIVNATGVPQKGINVYFSSNTDKATLDSNSQPVTTDGNGVAHDTLSVAPDAPAEITITATSSTLTQTVKVTKSNTAANRPPVAVIVAEPLVEQAVGRPLVFQASNSSDPDTGDSITKYKWVVTSDVQAGNPIYDSEGPTLTSLTFPPFANEQTLSVLLTVTDRFHATGSASITYKIKSTACVDNSPPTARIVGTGNPAAAPVGTHVFAHPEGNTSTDNSRVTSYAWKCGDANNSSGGTDHTANCEYVVASTKKTYTITLIVTDDGAGGPGPTYSCQKQSAPATLLVDIDVSPAQ